MTRRAQRQAPRPGGVDTELPRHDRREIQEAMRDRFARERLRAGDAPGRSSSSGVAIDEVLLRPTGPRTP
jgi:hypothetical protein